ncbi:hypothetical protein P5P86_02170 [Nocardioides sp. BP30]|uniref:hypothetical protein n=1 Tax=Nocardioides sp. BP30 TaxID=3036374 RepID=UPI0024695CC1|nr:hypothetical protein [Nocardioides sp. BP30]WGL52640.1 hypothetical protein P5P86_02170 [Nocardioides sp. BP30]
MTDEYWSLDIPGLDEDGANRLLAVAETFDSVEAASVIDPTLFYSMHLSREAVVIVVRLLRASLSDASLTNDDTYLATNLREELTEWLEQIAFDE